MIDAGYRARDRQITFPQLFHIWQFVEIAKAEVIEKKLSRLIQKRSPGDFGASGNFDETALHQCLQHAIDVHAANRFHIGTRNGLAICNNRQRFQRRRTQPRRLWGGKKLTHPRRVFRISSQLPAFRVLDQLKSAALLNVPRFQLFERGGNFGFTHARKLVRPGSCWILCALDCRDYFTDRQRLLRAEQKRFDYFVQGHKHNRRVILSPSTGSGQAPLPCKNSRSPERSAQARSRTGKDLALEVFDMQISLCDPLPFASSLTAFRDDSAFCTSL